MALVATLMAGDSVRGAGRVLARSQREQAVELECSNGEGPWEPCRMGIVQIGTHWWIELSEQRIHFEHDGSGLVRMQAGATGDWVPVESSWAGERVLCWGSLCARGAMPLD